MMKSGSSPVVFMGPILNVRTAVNRRYPFGVQFLVVHHALDWGGSSRAAVDLANHFASRGHSVCLPGLARTGEWHYDLDEGVEPVELTRNAPLEKSWKIWAQTVTKLRSLLRRVRPDVVFSIGALPNFVAIAANAGLRAPLVLSERADPAVMEGRRYPLFRNLVYRFQRADAFVVLTEEAAAVARGWMADERVHVIPNPVPASAVARPPGGCGERTVLAVGRLVPQKGFDMLLNAWALIAGSHPGWRLRIVGEGADRPLLEAQVARLGLGDTVELPGFDPNPFAQMARAELFVLSSRYEGFAHVLVEAMACALPVVAMDSPSGPRGIVRDGVDGFITPRGDVPALAAAMSKLIGDPALRDTIGARARDGTDRFSPERVWRMWDDVVERIVRAAPPPARGST
jgi:GalNAc-alpha-(1->4)-GalNAc-alpha-(1->3)-diNAcBac-PP-undecaprenol alpha-1,4-N-acetyl-D-galactosaminyltransferase